MAYDELKWAVDSVKKFGEGFIPKNMRKFHAIQSSTDTVNITFLEPTGITGSVYRNNGYFLHGCARCSFSSDS